MFAALPWWASLYLLLVLGLCVASLFTEKKRSHHDIVGSAMSMFSICTFILCFYISDIAQLFGYLVIPMTIVGIYWEFTRAVQETSYAREMLAQEGDLTEGEQNFLLNVAVSFNALVVVPGYLAGIIVSLRALGLSL